MAIRRNASEKRKKIPTAIKVVFLLITAIFIFNTARFFYKKAQLDARRRELTALIEEEEGKEQLYMEELSKVGTKEYYEYLARKQLGFIYPDEKVMIITDGTTQQ